MLFLSLKATAQPDSGFYKILDNLPLVPVSLPVIFYVSDTSCYWPSGKFKTAGTQKPIKGFLVINAGRNKDGNTGEVLHRWDMALRPLDKKHAVLHSVDR